MSKTAAEWIKEGLEFSKKNNDSEALKCYNEAITVDPNCGEAYFRKGFINADPKLLEEECDLYRKAISLGYDTAQAYFCLGVGLKDLGRHEEGLAANIKALEKNPDYYQAYDNKGQALMALGRTEESAEAYANAIRLHPEGRPEFYCHLGSLLETLGKTDEAMENYKKAISRGSSFGYYLKGQLEFSRGKYEEAISDLLMAKQKNFAKPLVCSSLGVAYQAVGKETEAMQMYELGTTTTIQNCHGYCCRGQCYFALGKKKEALEDFRKAQELLMTDKKTVFSPHYIKFIKETLKAMFEAEEIAVQTEAELAKLNPKNSSLNKFVGAIKKLQEEKDKANSQLMTQIGKGSATKEGMEGVDELKRLKEEFQKQLNEMKAEMSQVKTQVQTLDKKVTDLANNMEEMKEELKNKLDDFEKKLDSELNKQDLSPEDQQKLKGYFNAFVQTFSCVYVTSQVVDSGQVSLDTGSSATTILSALASFAPFVGNALSSGITSIGQFLKSQELIKNARRMKGLARDPVALSQIIGQAGFEILQNKDKQKNIINITDEDLNQVSGNLYQKILDFCEKMQEKIDSFLYTELYSTPAERQGHNDANQLISEFIKGSITPFGAQKQFVKAILNPATDTSKSSEGPPQEKDKNQQRSACCNMF